MIVQERVRKALEGELFAQIGEQITRLPPRYFSVHRDDQILVHARALRELTEDYPVRIVARRYERGGTAAAPGACSFTVCTRDAPGLFSYISGILGARGFNIQAGEVFTSLDGLVVDSFEGLLEGEQDPERWCTALERELSSLFTALRSSPPDPDSVRMTVVERVARRFAASKGGPGHLPSDPLLPVRISIKDDQAEALTRVSVVSQDTPFFLYSLANALALQDMSIRHVEIETRGQEVKDTFWIEHARGGAVSGEADRERLQLSILVTKQFTHALDQAADPKGAFYRFEELVRSVAGDGSGAQLQMLLEDPTAQGELARLLGASDFLWQDFIRLQYESLLPLLRGRRANRSLSTPPAELAPRLDGLIAAAKDADEEQHILNQFKDHEAYLIDADHILQRDTDFFFLSHRLTALAEVVVAKAYQLVWERLVEQYGTPRSAAGLRAEYAVFGLGKLGGSALGYASDIELMTIYSDDGDTDGAPSPVTNREFFERLVQGVDQLIISRRESIFEIDLRLRPYGQDGPRAVHVESFINYFGPGGKAHSAERLALIRMRPIAGDPELGRRMIAIRDHLVYETESIIVEEIRDLRLRQAEEKAPQGRLNAKFSPGALVDLEYNVQLLQVQEGRRRTSLRNPGIHATLRELSEAGTIDSVEAEAMIRAYRFFRNVINGLRMLRGNAQDLFLPDFDTIEAAHLARRMGYRDSSEQTAAVQFRVDFEVESAAVRSFVERHLGEEAIPAVPAGNPADLILSDTLTEERSLRILQSAGFRNPSRGIVNLRRIAGRDDDREHFARLLVLAWDYLTRSGDPDMALNNWDRFTEQVTERSAFFRELLSQPRRLEIMILIFSGSQFLSDTLIRNPQFLNWISDSAVVTARRDGNEVAEELRQELTGIADRQDRLDIIRRYRRREILRIGTKDICLGGDFDEVVGELSNLARSIVQVAFELAREEHETHRPAGRLCILAFGKLGGNELNYSSDIDLLGIYEPDEEIPDQEQNAAKLFRQVVRDLSDFTTEGQAYRVDLRLRPWGNAGRLAYALPTARRYYESEAELWELQALLKLSPLAGDLEVGENFLASLRVTFTRRIRTAGREAVLGTIRHLRARSVEQYASSTRDIKNGEGGIRDIEFLVQGLQLLYHEHYPALLTGNTRRALQALEETGILDSATASELARDYLFLRRIEHFLQVYDDRQLHAIPAEEEARAKLARVVGRDDRDLLGTLETVLTRVRRHYSEVVAPGAP